MIRTAKVTINGQEFSLRYPYSQLMEHVIRGTLSSEYPFRPFLSEERLGGLLHYQCLAG